MSTSTVERWLERRAVKHSGDFHRRFTRARDSINAGVMNDRIARQHLRINVLRADQVGVWHCMLKLALELDKPGAPLRSVALGCFDYVCADGRSGTFTPELMAQVFALPLVVVASTIDTLLELQILTRDGTSLRIADAADWFVPAAEHPSLRN